MTPITIFTAIFALTAGAVCGWLFARQGAVADADRRGREEAGRLADAERRAAGEAARAVELRGQVAQMESRAGALSAELTAERAGRVRAETEGAALRERLREESALIALMREELTGAFAELSRVALKQSNEQFLDLASERIGAHREALDGMLKPLGEAISKYEASVQDIEVKRKRDYTSLDEQIKMLAATHRELKNETGNLVAALRKPHVRGRWGEVTLRNVVELAGMSPHCDFTEQVTAGAGGEGGRIRPDMVIHMPGSRDVVVDAKVSLDGLLDAAAASTEEERRAAIKRHAGHLRKHVEGLASKDYWRQFEHAPELVVMFVGEAALVAALEGAPDLIEDALGRKVMIATPTTLFALLSAVAFGWRQEQVAHNAEAVAALGRDLYERVEVWMKHMGNVGGGLTKALDAYNNAVGSLERRVLPAVRRFKDLGVTAGADLPELGQLDEVPRRIENARETEE